MYKKQEANHFKPLEFGKTTVYKRKEPKFYNDKDEEVTKVEFEQLKTKKRVTYLEKQLTYREYYKELENENKVLKLKNKSNSDNIQFNEAVLQDLIFEMFGGGEVK